MADELNALGYLYPPENEIYVNDIPMSKRLQNVLMCNNILYLSQLSIHSREEILGFRNMGKGTMTELDNICKEHGIQIHSLSPIKQSFIEYHFSNELLEMFMRHNILLSSELDAPAPCRLNAPDLDFACRTSADCLHQHQQVI